MKTSSTIGSDSKDQIQYIQTSLEDNIGVITLDHFKSRNALSSGLIDKVLKALDYCLESKARVVIIRAVKGAKVWSAGHDVRELPLSGRDPLAYDDPLRIIVRTIKKFPAPIVAMIEGGVWGGACEVSLACDLRIATKESTFAITPAKLGVPYNISGILTCMSAVSLATLKEMFFTAQPISAERAEKMGMINHVVDKEELEDFTFNMARQISTNSPLSVSVIKEQLRILSNAQPLMPHEFERIQGLRRKVYDSKDYHEGINAFLEKRASNFTGE